jgi:small subunit ribosomal protein S9
MPTTKTSADKEVKKPRAPRKTVAVHKTAAAHKPVHHKKSAEVELVVQAAAETAPVVVEHKHKAEKADAGRYIFATGRRKTSIANVRLFTGKGENVVNKKPMEKYFNYSYFKEEIEKPFNLTGLGDKYYFTCHVNGGGLHSQSGAVRHGISIALGQISEEVRKVLKKNGLLTRDDRRKERKKPGLKRARRSPQWAKR